MKQFSWKPAKRHRLLFSVLMLVFLSSCEKDEKKTTEAGIQISPAMQGNISGLYKRGTYVWETNNNNGYSISQDDTAKINVEFVSADQIKLQLITSSPVPSIKSFNLYCIDTTGGTPGISYFKFHKLLDSTRTHISSILVGIRYYQFPVPESFMTLSYGDYTITNGQYGSPLVRVTCSDFRK